MTAKWELDVAALCERRHLSSNGRHPRFARRSYTERRKLCAKGRLPLLPSAFSGPAGRSFRKLCDLQSDWIEYLPKVISEMVGQTCRFASIPGRESPPFRKLLLATDLDFTPNGATASTSAQ